MACNGLNIDIRMIVGVKESWLAVTDLILICMNVSSEESSLALNWHTGNSEKGGRMCIEEIVDMYLT